MNDLPKMVQQGGHGAHGFRLEAGAEQQRTRLFHAERALASRLYEECELPFPSRACAREQRREVFHRKTSVSQLRGDECRHLRRAGTDDLLGGSKLVRKT